MKNHTHHKASYYTFDQLDTQPHILHFVSGRQSGHSQGVFASLNMGLHVGDKPEDVQKNRALVAEAVGFSKSAYVFAQQTHSKNITQLSTSHAGKGLKDYTDALPDTDALVTNEKGLMLTVLSADCTLLLLHDPAQQVIAAIHAGWKGCVQRITTHTIRYMCDQMHCKSQDIHAALAPAISWQNYEVQNDLIQQVKTALGSTEGYIKEKDGKYYFDQLYANKKELHTCGIPADQIYESGYCTFEHADSFFSSRHDKGHTGRIAAGIMLK